MKKILLLQLLLILTFSCKMDSNESKENVNTNFYKIELENVLNSSNEIGYGAFKPKASVITYFDEDKFTEGASNKFTWDIVISEDWKEESFEMKIELNNIDKSNCNGTFPIKNNTLGKVITTASDGQEFRSDVNNKVKIRDPEDSYDFYKIKNGTITVKNFKYNLDDLEVTSCDILIEGVFKKDKAQKEHIGKIIVNYRLN